MPFQMFCVQHVFSVKQYAQAHALCAAHTETSCLCHALQRKI